MFSTNSFSHVNLVLRTLGISCLTSLVLTSCTIDPNSLTQSTDNNTPEQEQPPASSIDYDYILKNGVIPQYSGHATRYWDGCKGHCGWSGNTDGNPIKSCDINNQSLADHNEQSSCEGGGSYTCWDMAPKAISETLSFGFAAVPGSDSENVCGLCYEFTFTGTGKYDDNDLGSGKLKAANKKIVVMATNIGYDVHRSQFDILIPGGGVGAFDAASDQWGVGSSELGKQYGGFLTTCRENLGWNAEHELVKQCVRNSCNRVFDEPAMTDLNNSCHWFVDWFEVADNPEFTYSEVSCPQELVDRAY